MYGAATSSAKALLGRKGTGVNLLRKGQGTFDPITQTRAVAADITARFNCVGLPPGKSAETQIGTLVGRHLMQFYMARTYGTIDPQPGDQLFWRGRTYVLVWTANYDPDNSGTVFSVAFGEVT